MNKRSETVLKNMFVDKGEGDQIARTQRCPSILKYSTPEFAAEVYNGVEMSHQSENNGQNKIVSVMLKKNST